jgi:hypothetical protein
MASIAAGGAATVGTGALSSIQAQRTISGKVVGDEKAYLEINGYDTSENSFAVETRNNQLALDFDADPDYDEYDESNSSLGNEEAFGLNPDAVSSFDRVFRIQNDGTEPLAVYIEDSLDAVSWYGTKKDSEDGEPPVDPTTNGDSIEGRSNAVTLQPFDDAEGNDNTDNDPVSAELDVGVVIDLTGRTSTGEVFGNNNNFTIYADDTNA